MSPDNTLNATFVVPSDEECAILHVAPWRQWDGPLETWQACVQIKRGLKGVLDALDRVIDAGS